MAWSRRSILMAAWAAAACGGRARADTGEDVVGGRLSRWRPGGLDIHHIATGRGDSTLIIGPDGSSLMIDAGATTTPSPPAFAGRPDAGRRPGEWIARYASRRLKETGGSQIDVFLATHQDPDHIGGVDDATPMAEGEVYRLTGVVDVDAVLGIGRLVDRGYPDYDLPTLSVADHQQNYRAFVAARQRDGKATERFKVGSLDQLRRDTAAFPDFSIRNLAANGEVWTGRGAGRRRLFPHLPHLSLEDVPEENVWSTAIRVAYGNFAYFTAGDLTSSTFDGALPWRDVETAAARACGPVDVAVTPHHGMFDATGADAARALSPRIWIVPAWHALHPSPNILDRLFNARLYPGARDVFATGIDPQMAAAAPWLIRRLASREGHVVVRVEPGGRSYRVVVTDHADENDRIKATFGPFPTSGAARRPARSRQTPR